MNEYCVPAGPGEAELVEKRSRFLGHLRPVESEEEALAGATRGLVMDEVDDGLSAVRIIPGEDVALHIARRDEATGMFVVRDE